MGGMAEGGKCAEVALSTFLDVLTRREDLPLGQRTDTAARAANSEIHRRYRERGGTTLVAVVFARSSIIGVSVGDSRLYAFHAGDQVRQLSTDDTVAGELNKMAGSKRSYSGLETFAGQLTQFVGIGEAIQPRLYSLKKDEAYLLTSDGAHSISPETLEQLVKFAKSPHDIVARLLNISKWCGGHDNATVICLPVIAGEWYISPRWSRGAWLELWDSSGKLEIPVEHSQTAIAVGPPKPDIADRERKEPIEATLKPRTKKKSGTSKQRALNKPAPEQRDLQIEIVDATAAQATDSQNSDSTATVERGPTRPPDLPGQDKLFSGHSRESQDQQSRDRPGAKRSAPDSPQDRQREET
jgi:serine/threonine protein phosphatase PrpC